MVPQDNASASWGACNEVDDFLPLLRLPSKHVVSILVLQSAMFPDLGHAQRVSLSVLVSAFLGRLLVVNAPRHSPSLTSLQTEVEFVIRWQISGHYPVNLWQSGERKVQVNVQAAATNGSPRFGSSYDKPGRMGAISSSVMAYPAGPITEAVTGY